MKVKDITRIRFVITLLMLCLVFVTGCKNYLEIPLPTDKLAADGAYGTDNAAGAVITGIISTAASSTLYGSANTYESIGFRTSLYVDDFQLLNPLAASNGTYNTNNTFYINALTSANSSQWSLLYTQLYRCNLAIEGINANQDKLSHKNQWLGEALFLRAFTYFDLVNLYGDVPVSTNSDYLVNNVLSRSPQAKAYELMISDLKQAEGLLGTSYLDGFSQVTTNRARPNQLVAAALLARVYLYTGDWVNAEAEATKIINSTTNYQLLAPGLVFLANSKETLFALAPIASAGPVVVRDYGLYNSGMPVVNATTQAMATIAQTPVSQSLLNTFEPNDARFTNWLRLATTTTPAATYYFANKYKSNVAGTEFNVLLRLGEQYLIRAEARTKQNNLSGAQADLNAIRTRASLPNTAASTPIDLMTAILKERRVELFTECGHRFYDLKRTGNIDAVMTVASPLKGGTWNSQKQIWPIPAADILADPNLTQAPGYNN